MMRLKIAALVSAAALMLSGCGMLSHGVYNTTLPGGADVGSHPMTITADFDDVLDLVPQSSVKVDNVAVGRVSKIKLSKDGRTAEVTLTVNGSVDLPAGTTARLKQTSLLGEKYVALQRPSKPQPGQAVQTGAHLGLADTSQSAIVEQVLGSLSLILNGGDIGQFQEISREIQKISDGRPEQIRDFLEELKTTVTGLDKRKESITAAIDGLAKLSTTLNNDKSKIVKALDDLSPGMQVIADQRKQLVAMLSALDKLSDVTVDTLNASQEDIVADFKALEPILTQLAKSGSDLPNALQILLTYPFPDSVLGAIKGDYLNVFITTNFRTLPAGCAKSGCSWPQPSNSAGATFAPLAKKPNGPSASPMLLPPTSSSMPGIGKPTIKVPTKTPSPSKSTASPTPTKKPTSTPSTKSSPTTKPTASPRSTAGPTTKDGD